MNREQLMKSGAIERVVDAVQALADAGSFTPVERAGQLLVVFDRTATGAIRALVGTPCVRGSFTPDRWKRHLSVDNGLAGLELAIEPQMEANHGVGLLLEFNPLRVVDCEIRNYTDDHDKALNASELSAKLAAAVAKVHPLSVPHGHGEVYDSGFDVEDNYPSGSFLVTDVDVYKGRIYISITGKNECDA